MNLDISDPGLFAGRWYAYFYSRGAKEEPRRSTKTYSVWTFFPNGNMTLGARRNQGARYGYSPEPRLLYLDDEDDHLYKNDMIYRVTEIAERSIWLEEMEYSGGELLPTSDLLRLRFAPPPPARKGGKATYPPACR